MTIRRYAVALFATFAVLSGCISTDDGPDAFKLCGNMIIDRNEQCDDGNTSDGDDCLTTCAFNQCGDEFLDTRGPDHIEACDGRNLNGRSCSSLGFSGGTLSCATDCSFDTSACMPRPSTPTPPPTATATVR